MATRSERVPVDGIAKAVVIIAAHCHGVLAGAAIGNFAAQTVIDLEFDGIGIADPAPDQADSAFKRPRLRAFQIGPDTAAAGGPGIGQGIGNDLDAGAVNLIRFQYSGGGEGRLDQKRRPAG